MPIYEYFCQDCRRKVSLLWPSFSAAESRPAVCPRCAGGNLRRLISRVAVHRSSDAGSGESAAADAMPDVNDEDPKSLARWMRQMAGETGEELGPEFDEVVSRLEAGEDPESIEKSLPADDTGATGDDFGVM